MKTALTVDLGRAAQACSEANGVKYAMMELKGAITEVGNERFISSSYWPSLYSSNLDFRQANRLFGSSYIPEAQIVLNLFC